VTSKQVIGLCGPEGAGKSTVAQLLCVYAGADVVPFAAPLKRMLETVPGIEPRHLYGGPADKAEALGVLGGKSAREAMQTLGTEWGRRCIDDGFWVRAWRGAVDAVLAPVVVADDVRFANEAETIRETGGVVICVVRSMNDFQRAPRHPSENFAAVPADWVLINDRDPETLRTKLFALLDLCFTRTNSPERDGSPDDPPPRTMWGCLPTGWDWARAPNLSELATRLAPIASPLYAPPSCAESGARRFTDSVMYLARCMWWTAVDCLRSEAARWSRPMSEPNSPTWPNTSGDVAALSSSMNAITSKTPEATAPFGSFLEVWRARGNVSSA
jgi:hypothetical protein